MAGTGLAQPGVVELGCLGVASIDRLLGQFGLRLILVDDGVELPGSYWGGAEAGLRGDALYARRDTPIHSVLHEAAHYVCMTDARRAALSGDAGGDDLEECAVCYLQVLLARYLPAPMGRARMCQDMDSWGYSFREGSAAAWLAGDGREARAWLAERAVIDAGDHVTFNLRGQARREL